MSITSQEKRRLRIKQLCIIAGVIIIPLAYSLFYLGAFWDPYSRLDKLPVAVVNLDSGASIDGKDRNLGNEMVDRLKTDDSLKWAFTDEKDGKAGVNDAKYYAMIVIPQNFSANIASAEGTDKKTALLTYEANEKRNFLASQILNRAVLELEEKARADVNRELTQQLTGKLDEVPGKLQELNDGIGDMKDGAKKLDDGAADLKDGAVKLDDGAGDLTDGANKLDDGAADLKNGAKKVDSGAAGLASGAKKLNDGVADLQTGAKSLSDNTGKLDAGLAQADAGAKALAQGAAQLPALTKGISDVDAGAVSLKSGVDGYVQGVDALIGQNEQVAAALANYVSRNPAAAIDPALGPVLQQLSSSGGKLDELKKGGAAVKSGAAQLKGGADQLKQGTAALPALTSGAKELADATTQLKEGSTQLYAGSKALVTGVTDLKTGSAALASGASDLKNGTSSLKNGASDLKNGTSDLKSGASDLKNGTSDLKGGTTDLKDGTNEMLDGVGTAGQKVDDAIGDANTELKKTEGLDDFAAEPVKLDNATTNVIPNYGTAFAPYFMSLSLWVGAIILFVGIYLDPDNRFPMLSRSSDQKLARVGAFAMISLIQSCLLAFLVIHVLHLQVHNAWAFYLTCVLVSMVFTSIVEFLIVNLGDIGKFLAIVFLVLQLTACGGTFPMETVPGFFNAIYRYMPMTYSVNLLKETISGMNLGSAAHDVVVLLSIFAVFTAATIAFSLLRRTKARNELPALS